MKVCDLMSDHVVSVGMGEPVSAAARLLRQQNVGSLPVCDDAGRLVGIVTDRDIVLRCVAVCGSAEDMTVSDVMTHSVVTASPFDSAGDAARRMADAQVRRLPVCKDGELVGMLALGDLARDSDCDMEAADALTEISGNIRRRR
jgi:CBS domain-containing protein